MEIFIFIFVAITFINVLGIKKQLSDIQSKLKDAPARTDKYNVSPVAYEASAPVPEHIAPSQPVSAPLYQSIEAVAPAVQEVPKVVSVPPVSPGEMAPVEKNIITAFTEWFSHDWLAKFGGLILLIGIGWFVSYAFAEGWIGEQGRIALGLIVAAFMLLFGYIRIRVSSLQGGLFLVLGLTTVLMTIWAAQGMYSMFPPVVALSLMFLATAFVSVVAVVLGRKSLATIALISAFVAPLLTNAPTASFGGLHAYLLVVVAGTIFMVAFTSWRHLILISLYAVWQYGFPFSYNVSPDIAGVALLYAFVFSAIFIVMANRTLVYNVKHPSTIDLYTIGGTGLYLLMWINAAAPGHWEALLYVAWAITFAVIGYVMFLITEDMRNFLVNGAVSLTYIVLATVATFDESALTLALSIEAATLPVLAYMITKRKALLINLSLPLLVPVLLSIESIATPAWSTTIPFGDFMVLLVLGCVGVGLGLYTNETGKRLQDNDVSLWGGVLMILGSLYFLVLIWLVPQGVFAPNYDLGRLISLVVYTVIGVMIYVVGHTQRSKSMRTAGGILVGLVIFRLLMVEVWDMQMSLRITTFLLIGALLIATAFIQKKDTTNV